MIILNHQQIENKIRRIASEIYEAHAEAPELILVGINNKGFAISNLLCKLIQKMGHKNVNHCHLTLNPANPLDSNIVLDRELNNFKDVAVIVVDDVVNSGRTLFFALQPFTKVLTQKLEVCVLVERMHKAYPVSVDYVGMRLATTVKQNIEIVFEKNKPVEAQMF
ncbi:MAG: phosphoribosyltransferase [Saprospiraceae bacterium]|nr:phosphoribosyltransferase [Saprospiraceae bacterium]